MKNEVEKLGEKYKMKPFLDEQFLLQNDTAVLLYKMQQKK